ncbi:hypothetical protein THASP1DRAFT_23622 [Thamnocephalis sphaerospora]|uniref:Uncharacterized protein n=1 Tax=Thamnocephalis sphaerospora TaxID=78915 RepID=A0A4P9XSM7_9FUNG|nr:hypothetical protein THASP1DRAFT_23622 [Thamnocephalis sphaerospora]|eukprot:RKP08370.1 hypothetical protein THASP1DRAFT_23622 [Thamnocephalis sphaerospora]
MRIKSPIVLAFTALASCVVAQTHFQSTALGLMPHSKPPSAMSVLYELCSSSRRPTSLDPHTSSKDVAFGCRQTSPKSVAPAKPSESILRYAIGTLSIAAHRLSGNVWRKSKLALGSFTTLTSLSALAAIHHTPTMTYFTEKVMRILLQEHVQLNFGLNPGSTVAAWVVRRFPVSRDKLAGMPALYATVPCLIMALLGFMLVESNWHTALPPPPQPPVVEAPTASVDDRLNAILNEIERDLRATLNSTHVASQAVVRNIPVSEQEQEITRLHDLMAASLPATAARALARMPELPAHTKADVLHRWNALYEGYGRRLLDAAEANERQLLRASANIALNGVSH